MIDNFSILLSHGWLLLAFWLLLQRTDLNNEPPPTPDPEPQGFSKRVKSLQESKNKPAGNPYRKTRGAKPASGQGGQDSKNA
jgi:hypothetical protein